MTAVLALQIVLGGIMSGMKAGLFYPTWPDMNGALVPNVLFNAAQWNVENFVNYDKGPFMAALIQTLHRSVAYLLTFMVLWFFFRLRKSVESRVFNFTSVLLITMLIIQVMLGILTVINCKSSIPVELGVMHQGGALLLLSIALFMNYQLIPGREK